MSRTQMIIAARTLRYGTRMLKAGDMFEAKERDARLLLAIGRAKEIIKEAVPVDVTPPTEAETAKIKAALGGTVLDALRAEYRERSGKAADGRWSQARLTAEVSTLRNVV